VERGNDSLKNKNFQILRGLAIIAVVFCHAYNVLDISAGKDYWIYLVIRQAASFPVAVFVFMAGYFVNIDEMLRFPGRFLKIRGAFVDPIFYVDGGLRVVLSPLKNEERRILNVIHERFYRYLDRRSRNTFVLYHYAIAVVVVDSIIGKDRQKLRDCKVSAMDGYTRVFGLYLLLQCGVWE